jgi:hypothetical protein
MIIIHEQMINNVINVPSVTLVPAWCLLLVPVVEFMLFSDWSNRESTLESSSKRKRIKYCMYLYICNQEIWVVWVVPEKIRTPPTEEISAIRRR